MCCSLILTRATTSEPPFDSWNKEGNKTLEISHKSHWQNVHWLERDYWTRQAVQSFVLRFRAVGRVGTTNVAVDRSAVLTVSPYR